MIDQDLRDLRSELHEGLASGRGEINGLRSEINDLRHLMLQIGGGMLVGFISVLAAILVARRLARAPARSTAAA